jgi:hypothetical protein
MIFKIPTIISKFTLLSYVIGIRMMVVYGLTSTYLSIWALSVLSKYKYVNKMHGIFVCILITCTYYLSIVDSPMKKYLEMKYYVIIIIVLFILNYLLIYGQKYLFSILMMVIILVAGIAINPIARGTGAIYNNRLSYAIRHIQKRDPNVEWICADDGLTGYMGPFLYANGVNTIGGTDFYPDLKKWNKLGFNITSGGIYNRYAHVNFKIYRGKLNLQLVDPDSILVELNPRDLKKYKIKYILTKDNLEKFNNTKKVHFKIVYSKDIDGFYIFAVSYK